MAHKNPLGKLKDLTRGAVSVGKLTAGAVSKLVQGRKLTIEPAPEPVAPSAAKTRNETVNVTPADVAKAVAKKAPARKPATTTAPAAKKASARKTTPGAKLPPRKKVEQD